MTTELVSALIGLVVGVVGTYVKTLLANRAAVGEELRGARLAPYEELWKDTQLLSRWPRWPLTAGELRGLHERLRAWYYETGGLYLSTNARVRYGEVQQLIAAVLRDATDDAAGVADRDYDDLMDTCSALRTAITEDLESRRQRSFWTELRRRREHDAQARAARLRIKGRG